MQHTYTPVTIWAYTGREYEPHHTRPPAEQGSGRAGDNMQARWRSKLCALLACLVLVARRGGGTPVLPVPHGAGLPSPPTGPPAADAREWILLPTTAAHRLEGDRISYASWPGMWNAGPPQSGDIVYVCPADGVNNPQQHPEWALGWDTSADHPAMWVGGSAGAMLLADNTTLIIGPLPHYYVRTDCSAFVGSIPAAGPLGATAATVIAATGMLSYLAAASIACFLCRMTRTKKVRFEEDDTAAAMGGNPPAGDMFSSGQMVPTRFARWTRFGGLTTQRE